MKKIGMLVAVEMDAVLRRYGTAKTVENRHGFEMHLYDMGAYELYVLRSGAGEIAAAAAAELLIDRYEVELIVNFGVVGGLTAEMGQTKTCVVERATAICPDLKRVTCASADKFIEGREAKSALHERWDADICEMEAAAVVLTCDRAAVPCLLIKTVSDGLTQGGEDFGTALAHTSALCLEVADRIIREL